MLGACRDAVALTHRTVETELNSTGDNSVVLADPDAVVPTANFHSAALSLAMDTLSLALAQATAMATNRVLRLMTPELSGLPHQLTPALGDELRPGHGAEDRDGATGGIRLQASPASLDYLPVADAVEDHATMATLGVARADTVVGLARSLIAIELLCGRPGHRPARPIAARCRDARCLRRGPGGSPVRRRGRRAHAQARGAARTGRLSRAPARRVSRDGAALGLDLGD